MSKRVAEPEEDGGVSLKDHSRPENGLPDETELNFEDDFEDEFESEDEIMEAGLDGRPDADREAEQRDAMEVDTKEQTFIPGRSILPPGLSLAPDPTSYEMLHVMQTTWPCLSFDIVRDNLGDHRKQYPRTVYAVAGTQAESSRSRENELLILKLSSLSRMNKESLSESEDDEDDDDDEDEVTDAVLESRSIPLHSVTNRIRCFQPTESPGTQIATTLTATSLENAKIVIHNVTNHLKSLASPGITLQPHDSKPLAELKMHKTEGYALDWAPTSSFSLGRLLSGDCNGEIYSTQRNESGGFLTDSRPYLGHTGSVEELQWSPSEKNVFASASTDGTVKVWDVRSKSRKPAVDAQISQTDVNVMSWSRQTAHLLATGCDDGRWSVWDLRQWKNATGEFKPSPVASFHFHQKAITSIEWHPSDDSVVAVASADSTTTLWDLSVEIDDEEYGRETGLGLGEGSDQIPPQCLFIHHAEDGKELHWHPQLPGTLMVTGGTGFGIFKTISV